MVSHPVYSIAYAGHCGSRIPAGAVHAGRGAGGPLRVETKDGSRIAFVRETRGSLLAGIVVTRSDGTLVREILFRPAEAHVSGMRWVESPEWISNRSEEHTSELQSPCNLVCRLLLEKKTK